MSIKDTLSQAAAIRDAVGQTVGKTVGTVAKDQMNHVVSTVLKQRSYKVLHAADASSRVAEQSNRDLLFRLL